MKPAKELPSLYIVEVIPIVRGLPKPVLTYFTKEKLGLGSFVNININNSDAFGLVTKIFDARLSKTEIKKSTYTLKKLVKNNSGSTISPSFIRAATRTAEYYALPVGNILGKLIPKSLLESPDTINQDYYIEEKTSKKDSLIIQLSDKERFMEYRSIIRGSFAKSKSIVFITPTHEDALRSYDILSKGIKEYTYITAKKSSNKIKELLRDAKKNPHPILLITTPAYIGFNRFDLETIIVEKENSRLYRSISKPFIDYKIFIEIFAEESGKTLILGDTVLSLKTLLNEKKGKSTELSPLKWKVHYDAQIKLIDMKALIQTSEDYPIKFKIFSTELENLINRAIDEKRKIFLYGARKGLAPSTVCRDCGSVLSCPNCVSPLILHENINKDRFYLCHLCGTKKTAETRCDHCNSWNLIPLGIGIDRISEEIQKMYPDVPVTVLDKSHTPNSNQVTKAVKGFAEQKGGILIGTDLALLYIEKIPYVGVVSIDTLFSIPDFSINERIFYLITRILEKGEKEIVIQTRNIKKEILNLASKGDILALYRSEMKEREEMFYPPFSLFIKISIDGSEKELGEHSIYLKNIFLEFEPDFIKSRSIRSGYLTLSMIIRVQREKWPFPSLLNKMVLLPSNFLIKVDPDSII